MTRQWTIKMKHHRCVASFYLLLLLYCLLTAIVSQSYTPNEYNEQKKKLSLNILMFANQQHHSIFFCFFVSSNRAVKCRRGFPRFNRLRQWTVAEWNLLLTRPNARLLTKLSALSIKPSVGWCVRCVCSMCVFGWRGLNQFLVDKYLRRVCRDHAARMRNDRESAVGSPQYCCCCCYPQLWWPGMTTLLYLSFYLSSLCCLRQSLDEFLYIFIKCTNATLRRHLTSFIYCSNTE